MKIIYKLIILCFFMILNVYNVESYRSCDEFSRCIPVENCPEYNEMLKRRGLSREKISIISSSQCGLEHINGKPKVSVCCPICGKVYDQHDKIYGGNETGLQEFPWTVLIREKGGTFDEQLCGGSIINKRYIITAAHCLKFNNNYTKKHELIDIDAIRLGEWNKLTDIDCKNNECADKSIDYDIDKIIVHPNFIPKTNNHNDIALIRLKKNINYTKYIQSICLPLENHLKYNHFINETFNVVGWGKTEHTNSTSNIKLKATINTYNHNNCNRIYYYNYHTEIIDKQICAGGVEGIDSCKGDSGGPLIGLDLNDILLPKHYLAGIVSFGPNPCAMSNKPGVYTKVGAYIDWILDNIEPYF